MERRLLNRGVPRNIVSSFWRRAASTRSGAITIASAAAKMPITKSQSEALALVAVPACFSKRVRFLELLFQAKSKTSPIMGINPEATSISAFSIMRARIMPGIRCRKAFISRKSENSPVDISPIPGSIQKSDPSQNAFWCQVCEKPSRENDSIGA